MERTIASSFLRGELFLRSVELTYRDCYMRLKITDAGVVVIVLSMYSDPDNTVFEVTRLAFEFDL
jgi:hypothetical protein